jgi:two-component system, OmpR family, response regulator RpaA
MTPTTYRAMPLKRPKILCIDDDPRISDALGLRLERYGIDVIAAFQGMQGFWTALDARPDAVICDLVMPGGEGNYIVSRFKSHALTKDVPVMVLTGHRNPAVKRQMLSLGVSAYLTKPLVLDELLRELRAVWPARLSAALDR